MGLVGGAGGALVPMASARSGRGHDGCDGSCPAALPVAGKGAVRSLWALDGGARIDGESRCEVERQFIRRVLGGFVPANPSLDH